MIKYFYIILFFLMGCQDMEFQKFKYKMDLRKKEINFKRSFPKNYDLCEIDPENNICERLRN